MGPFCSWWRAELRSNKDAARALTHRLVLCPCRSASHCLVAIMVLIFIIASVVGGLGARVVWIRTEAHKPCARNDTKEQYGPRARKTHTSRGVERFVLHSSVCVCVCVHTHEHTCCGCRAAHLVLQRPRSLSPSFIPRSQRPLRVAVCGVCPRRTQTWGGGRFQLLEWHQTGCYKAWPPRTQGLVPTLLADPVDLPDPMASAVLGRPGAAPWLASDPCLAPTQVLHGASCPPEGVPCAVRWARTGPAAGAEPSPASCHSLPPGLPPWRWAGVLGHQLRLPSLATESRATPTQPTGPRR